MKHISYNKIEVLIQRHNLHLYSVLNDLSCLQDATFFLEKWQKSGYASEMSYMERSPELLANPKNVLSNAKCAIVLGIPYFHGESTEGKKGFGRVAKYAFGRDYHKVFKKRLQGLLTDLYGLVGDFEYRLATDSVPLLERAVALRAGIGKVGRNSMLISRKYGSFFFLAEIFFDFYVDDIPLNKQCNDICCGKCQRCLKRCPNHALEELYVLNPKKCIAYLTIEHRGMFSIEERKAIGNWIFGCDECQLSCPYNKLAIKNFNQEDIFSEFLPSNGCGEWLDLSKVLKIHTHEEFVANFAGTPIMRAKREGLLRNAAVVAVNTDSYEIFDDIFDSYKNDTSELVKSHLLWALASLAPKISNNEVNKVKDLIFIARKNIDMPFLKQEAKTLY